MILLSCYLLVVVLLAVAAILWFRNRAVYRYRLGILETLRATGPFDFDWRIAVYDSVPYNEMVFKFWKPLDSFYPDKSFLDLNDVRGHAPWEKAS